MSTAPCGLNRLAAAQRVPLCRGWQAVVVELGEVEADDVLSWEVAAPTSVPGDTRELGVALRTIELFDDRRRYEMIGESQRNLALNQAEFLTGNAELESFPPQLRITAEVRCNLPETGQACVYCAWDWAKDLKRGSPPFTLQTLADLGGFYRSAIEIVDCSYGEPTMNKQFGEIVSAIDRDGKQYSLTSNGQLLSPKRRRELLGKNLLLYVSIDSATAAGYTRYRNDRFDDIITGLTATLSREKGARRSAARLRVVHRHALEYWRVAGVFCDHAAGRSQRGQAADVVSR